MTIDSRDSDEGDLYSDAIRKYFGPDVSLWEVIPSFPETSFAEIQSRKASWPVVMDHKGNSGPV